MYPTVRDKRRDVAITCFAMIDHSEKKTHCNFKKYCVTAYSQERIYSKSFRFCLARLSDLAVYPPICIAGTDEGEIFIIDWRNYSEMERGAGRPFNCYIFVVKSVLK